METYSTEGYTFTWNGGPYIDIYTEGAEAPFDCINVWDYDTSRAAIDGRIEFISECEQWLNDSDDEENISYGEDDGFFSEDYDTSDPYDSEYDCYV